MRSKSNNNNLIQSNSRHKTFDPQCQENEINQDVEAEKKPTPFDDDYKWSWSGTNIPAGYDNEGNSTNY
jgi:hypothetical protein